MRVLLDRVYGPDTDERVHWLPNGIAHPAKMAPALLVDLVRRYTLPGQTILDPFGGIGTTLLALAQGRNVILVELEAKFIAHARANLGRIRWLLDVSGRPYGQGVIYQGDSRRLPLPSAGCDGVVGSPPFGEMNAPSCGGTVKVRPSRDGTSFEGERSDWLYSEATAGQIGNLPLGDVDGVISSPPYADAITGDSEARRQRKAERYARGEFATKRPDVLSSPTNLGASGMFGGYSPDPANLGNLPLGDVERIVAAAQAKGFSPESLAAMRADLQATARASNRVEAVISSPPYADTINQHPAADDLARRLERMEAAGIDTSKRANVGGPHGTHRLRQAYGSVDAVVSSPPYTDVASRDRSTEGYAAAHPEHARDYGRTADAANRSVDGYGDHSPGQIGDLPPGEVDSVITSPPYAQAITQGGETGGWRAKYGYQGANDGYSTAAENIGNLEAYDDETRAKYTLAGERMEETYCAAVLQCYRECYRVIRPGGVLVLVVGPYVRNGKLVDLAADTIKLAVAAGWTPVERWRACKTQVSFWRRLHHKQRPDVPVVTWEDVLVFCRGPKPTWEFTDLPPTTRQPVALGQPDQPAGPATAQAALPLALAPAGWTEAAAPLLEADARVTEEST